MLLHAGFWFSLVHSQPVKVDIIEKTASVSRCAVLIPCNGSNFNKAKTRLLCEFSCFSFFHLITLLIDAMMH